MADNLHSLETIAQALLALVRQHSARQQAAQAMPGASPCLADVVNEFLLAKVRANRSERYIRQLHVTLAGFARGREARPVASITAPEIESWLYGAGWQPRTCLNYLLDLRTLFNFAVRRGHLYASPAQAIDKPACPASSPAVHEPAQVQAVLETARRLDMTACRLLAVRYFAGLRSAEALRLSEAEIHPGFIEVRADKAKTRARRLVEIQPALAAWLALPARLPLHDPNIRLARLVKAAGQPWPHNVTRHSFCSYHLAAFGNAARTALEAGHSEAMLFRHYRELVTPELAREFWAIRPCSIAG